MSALLDRIFSVPTSAAAREADLAERRADPSQSIALFATRIEQITNKSAALLQADSIFIAIALYAIQMRRADAAGTAALVLLTISCLLLASNLWSVFPRRVSEGQEHQLRLMYDLRIWRGVRFNLALYLFFAGVAVLALSAFL
jgi:hypothetical protein